MPGCQLPASLVPFQELELFELEAFEAERRSGQYLGEVGVSGFRDARLVAGAPVCHVGKGPFKDASSGTQAPVLGAVPASWAALLVDLEVVINTGIEHKQQ